LVKATEQVQIRLSLIDGDDITQPVGTEHTIDKAVGLTIGKTNLNAWTDA
jgi:tRNA U34 2-thiouridine synthase MnmA/TrmU